MGRHDVYERRIIITFVDFGFAEVNYYKRVLKWSEPPNEETWKTLHIAFSRLVGAYFKFYRLEVILLMAMVNINHFIKSYIFYKK